MSEWRFPGGAMLATQTPDAPVEPKYIQQVKLSPYFVEFSLFGFCPTSKSSWNWYLQNKVRLTHL